MLELQTAPESLTVPAAAKESVAAPRPPLLPRMLRWLAHGLAGLLALATVSGLVFVGHRYDWKMPKFADLMGHAEPPKDDWCADHSVPSSVCVECGKKLKAKGPEHGWCRKHGVAECPLCNPESAQLSVPASPTADDLAVAERALAFAPRVENNSKCKLHERRLQFASAAAADGLGIANAAAVRGAMEESIEANGELTFDPTAVVRLSARSPGVVWRMAKQVGDTVAAGELVAVIEAPEVGKAKAELQHALAAADLTAKRLARLQGSASVVPESQIIAADAEAAEAQVRVVAARQALVNLGLPVDLETLRLLPGEELAQRLQFLGLQDLATALQAQTQSSSLLPVRAPLAGEVIERAAVPGEAAEPGKALLTIADPKRLWLTLHVRLEDAAKVKIGQKVRFRHGGHAKPDEGRVAWISVAVDEKTRTLPLRVEFDGGATRHHARAFGSAEIVLREEPRALLVPSEAVHWEGDCNVVFVRDKDYGSSPLKVYHVRKVRPGGKEMTPNGSMTEIIAGLLPGELVATSNSGILRSELLKNNLGAG